MGRVHGGKFVFPPSEGTVPYSTGGDVLAPDNADRGQELQTGLDRRSAQVLYNFIFTPLYLIPKEKW